MRNSNHATTTNNALCITTQNVSVVRQAWQDAARPFARPLALRPMPRGPKPDDLRDRKSDGDPSGRLSPVLGMDRSRVRPSLRRSYRGVA